MHAGIGWGFMARLGWDLAWGKLADNEVARARELREIVTSLGPAYIKLGQALSIRPDILSPSAMYEMQKLCDKVSLLLRPIIKPQCCCVLVTSLACHALNVFTSACVPSSFVHLRRASAFCWI